jgi:DtxR family transcriptional regulator, Mn-dependent transcriptional regulator
MVSRNRGFGMPNQIETTSAVQDYLKAIYQLGGDREGVPTSALSERLGVSPASVSGMLKRLDEQGLVAHKRYQGARLTKRGARQAVEMIRHHRLLELYLAKVVGLPPDKVHAEADALEHVISEELESRLDELLGYPTEDPHGHPIPSADLVLTERDHPTLSSVEPGSYVVRHVDDRDAPLLKHLSELGVHPGAELVVTEQIPFRGGVRIAIAGNELVVGRDAAHAVGVEEVAA